MAGLISENLDWSSAYEFDADSWLIRKFNVIDEDGVTSYINLCLGNPDTGEMISATLDFRAAGYLGLDLLDGYIND